MGTRGTLSWDAVSTAVALLTAENGGDQGAAGDALGDADREEVVSALVLIGGCVLRELRPGPGVPAIGHQGAAEVLQAIGLRVAAEATR
jgi:hypothetical protein